MIEFLLDTSVLSEATKNTPNQGVLRKMQKHFNEMATASPVWHELQFGCMRLPQSARRSTIESFLFDVVKARLPILPYDESAAHWHADQRALLTNAGRPPSFINGQIASIARVNKLIVVTRNISDFEVFPDLVIENWFN